VFANRYTAFMDACVLAGVLRRNLLCTLAEAEFFRIRWSARVLDEAETAISRIVRDGDTPQERARRAREAMEQAFEDAMVVGFEVDEQRCKGLLPDPSDAHVLAAALKTRADVIVTDNLKHFPQDVLQHFAIEVRSADDFIAETITLDPGRAVAAVRCMRERFKRPGISADDLLLRMESQHLIAAVDALRPHSSSL
jgi:predicted nucleic acid-binding protein